METRMKLSELTYEFLQSVGLSEVSMHTDRSDALRSIGGVHSFENAKAELMEKYGDVNLIINPDAAWFDQIAIDDAKWKADHDEYCRDKAEWCRKYGCD